MAAATATEPKTKRRELYPPVDAYNTGMLKVSDVHTIYYEESGNPEGIPALVIHGGPGGGSQAKYRQFFDASKYRVIQFDQRGCGKSTPHASLEDNTTWHLVADIEALREKLGVETWVVFGGSWGSTLSLTYAIKHADRVRNLVLRGIFMLRRKELLWFYQEGGSYIYPDAWEPYEAAIPEEERGDMITAYYKRLTSPDAAVRKAAATAWSVWEGSTSKLWMDADAMTKYGEDEFADAFARIECHYFTNGGFFDSDEWILENVGAIKHIPAVIVQGRYDVVCPARSAWDLHRAWPEAKLELVQDAGHSCFEPGIQAQLLDATDAVASA